MKTKIVYVLSSDYTDIYAEQAFLSIYSLRHHQPDAHIVLLVDDKTALTLTGPRKKLVESVDEFKVIEFAPQFSKKVRSRLLKTSLREHVVGDCLYVDNDTIIMKPIDGIDEYCSKEGSVFAVRDFHLSFEQYPTGFIDYALKPAQIIGYSMHGVKDYFNGGIAWVREDDIAHEFYKRWNNNYLSSLIKYGIDIDQASFAQTNIEMGMITKHLDDIFNVQYRQGFEFWDSAVIFHYINTFCAIDVYHCVLQHPDLFWQMKKEFIIPERLLECLRHPSESIDYFSTFRATLKNHPVAEKALSSILKFLYLKRRGMKLY